MANTSNLMKEKEFKQKAYEAGGDLAEQAQDFATTAKEKAKEVASSAGKTAGQMASFVGQKAEDAATSLGSGMKSLGETVREKGPHSGVLGSATSAVANTLEGSGNYLKEHGLKGIGEDLTQLIRRNPIPALLIGIGIGFLLARATRS